MLSDVAWSDWRQWSACSATCGDALKTRSRTCVDPEPLYCGNFCNGPSSEKQLCQLDPCPIGCKLKHTQHLLVHFFKKKLLKDSMVIFYRKPYGSIIIPTSGTYGVQFTYLVFFWYKLLNWKTHLGFNNPTKHCLTKLTMFDLALISTELALLRKFWL